MAGHDHDRREAGGSREPLRNGALTGLTPQFTTLHPVRQTAPMRTVVAGILERDGKVLVGARSAPAWAAGQWEFPGGKVEGDETPAEALAREWREELGAEVEVLGEVYRSQLDTPVGPFTLIALRVRLREGEPRPLEHRALAWVAPPDLTRLPLLASNVPIAGALEAQEPGAVTGA